MLKISLFITLAFSFSAFAGGKLDEVMAECSSVKAACETAGYHGADQKPEKNKTLKTDCLDKIANGQKVDGVDVDPADPANKACITKMNAGKSEWKAKKQQAKAGIPRSSMPPAVLPAIPSPQSGTPGH